MWVFIFKIKKGFFKKLLYNYYGLYRIVEKFSLVYYCLCICGNNLVSLIVYVNCMKCFFDLNECLIEFLIDDFIDEFYFVEDDLLENSFEKFFLYVIELVLDEDIVLWFLNEFFVIDLNMELEFLIDN